MTNLKTGFWIRLIARLFDLIFISAIAVSILFLIMTHNNGWHFKHNWMFYIWTLMFGAMIFAWFILIPAKTGKTLFMWLFRIEITFEKENRLVSMIKREIFFSIMWIIMLFMLSTIINHTLISKYAASDQKHIVYTNWEKLRAGIVTSVGSILTIIQFIYAISIFVRGTKKGIHDNQSNTWTIWKNKLVEKPSEKTELKITPTPVNNEPVIWVD